MRWGLLTVALFFAIVGSAHAVTLVNLDGSPVSGPWQAWADESAVPTSPITLPFSADPATIGRHCWARPYADYLACTAALYGSTNGGPTFLQSIFIGVLPASSAERYDPQPIDLRANLYKELGQVFDATMLTDADRQAFIDLFPRATAAHFRCSYCTTMEDRWQYRPSGRFDMSSYAEWFGQGWEDCAAFAHITQGIVQSPMFRAADGFPVEMMEPWHYPSRWNGTFEVNRRRQAIARHKLAQVCALIRQVAAHGPVFEPQSLG